MFEWLKHTFDFILKIIQNFQERKVRKEKLEQEKETTSQKQVATKIKGEQLKREEYKTAYINEIYHKIMKQKQEEFSQIAKDLDLKQELEILTKNIKIIEEEVINDEKN